MRRTITALALAASLAAAGAQGRIEISIQAGPAFTHQARMGFILVKTRPQIAVWIETNEGRYVDTVFVTHRSAFADWYGGKGVRRPEALPIWSRARGIAAPDGLFMPDRAHPLADAVSGPTPAADFSLSWKSSLAPGRYRIRVELNQSFDWNEAYPDKLPKTDPRWTEANGQPSVLWEGELELGQGLTAVALKPLGTGALKGEDGRMRVGLEGMTSARDIASSITARFLASP